MTIEQQQPQKPQPQHAQPPVRIGLVGCGVMGRVYLQAAAGQPDLAIVAVADVQEAAARAAAAEFSISAWYKSAEAMIDTADVDAVLLAVPAAFRTRLALYAFARGKHALLEKPVALSATETERLLEAADGLVAASCSSRLRFADSAEAVRRLLEAGTIGALRTISCRWLLPAKAAPAPDKLPPAWRLSPALNGGGNLTNLGTYVLDYMLGVTGWRYTPAQVSGRVWTLQDMFRHHVPAGSTGETHTAAMIVCSGDEAGSERETAPVLLLEQGEYFVGPEEAAWQITGETGTIRFRIVPGLRNVVTLYRYSEANGVEAETVWSGDETFGELQRRVLRDFAGAIRERRPPRTTLRQAWLLQRTIEAVYQASESGQTVTLHPQS
ncbi:Gfo/Idh/MocA family protein [Paenibacillus sp. HJGM_3]|uniref:Gfo/Idh/MocA family protein n=1 Tax=Paenibacillus sp. HJGM_3 TaxID=3379816 RepID=UPI00385BA0B2